MNNYWMYLILFLIGMLFVKFNRNILVYLLSLEFMISYVVWIFYNSVLLYHMGFLMLLMLVIFIVEGVLGLSLVVSLIRFKGKEYVNLLSLSW